MGSCPVDHEQSVQRRRRGRLAERPRRRGGNVRSSTPAHRGASLDGVRTRHDIDTGTKGVDLTPELAILVGECVAKSHGDLEGRHGADRDGYSFVGAGIAAGARGAVCGGELAECRNVDGLASFKRIGDGRDDGVDRGGGIGPGQR